jgi:hypothetical protein
MRKNYKFESQSQSDAEIYDELSPEQIENIEDAAKKIFKKNIDLEKVMKGDDNNPEKEKSDEDEETNEALGGVSILGAVAIAGLVSLILTSLGNLTNLISKKTGLTLDENQWKQYRFSQKVIKAYKKLANKGSAELEIDGTKHAFTWKNWTEIGDKSAKHLLSLDYKGDAGILRWDHLKSSDEHHGEDEKKGAYDELLKKKKQGYAASADIHSKLKVSKNESMRYLKRYDEFILEGHGHTDFTKFKEYEITNTAKDKDYILKGVIPYINENIEKILPVKTKFGNALADAGHAIHESLILPIRACIKATAYLTGWKWAKKYENRDKLATILYCVIMVSFGTIAALDKLGHLHYVKDYVGLIKETWKGSENVKDCLKKIIELIQQKG